MSTFSCGAAITKVMAVSPEDTNFIFDKIKELEGLGATLEQAQKVAVADAIIRLETERQEVLAAVREKLAGMETGAPKKRKNPANNLRSSAYDKNPLMTFLATHGLYHDKSKPNSLKAEFSPDKAIMIMGYGPVFKKTGQQLDQLVPMAIQDGYLPTDGTERQLSDLIRRAVSGEKIVPMYAEGVAEAEAQSRMNERSQSFEDHLAQQQEAMQDEDFDPFQSTEELGFELEDAEMAGYDSAQDPIKLEVNALLALAESQGIDVDTIKEQVYEDTRNGSEQDYFEAARAAIKAAIERSNRDRRQDAGESGNAGSEAGLIAPTRADILSQQERTDSAAQSKEQADRASDKRARSEEDRKRIAKASEAAADTFELGGDAMANLTGQKDIFGQESATPTPEVKAQSESTANDRDHFILKNKNPSGISGAASSTKADGLGDQPAEGSAGSIAPAEPEVKGKPTAPRDTPSAKSDRIDDFGEKLKTDMGVAMFSRGEQASTGLTTEQFTAELTKAFGQKVAERLQAQGIVVPVADKSKIPGSVSPFLRDGDKVYGFYDPSTNRTYAVLENLKPDMVKGVVLHEVGVHFGFEGLLGIEKYAQVMKRVNVMRLAGNKAVLAAYAEAKQNAAHVSQVGEETIAYLVQRNQDMGLVREIIARIKAFLYEKFGIGGDSLTEADLTMLARSAVLHATRTGEGKGLAPAFVRGTTEPVTKSNDAVGNQGGRSADDINTGTDENTGLPLNADGTVTVYHHTSAANAKAIRQTGMLKAQAEPDVYVTTRQEVDTGYGDTAVPIRINPDQLAIDDEFPDGRKDFRLSTGKPGGSIRVTVENEPTAPDSGGAIAPTGMFVGMQGKNYEVDSFKDAGLKYRDVVREVMQRRANGETDVAIPFGGQLLPVSGPDGKVIAYAAMNGRVYPASDIRDGMATKSGAKPSLYDPYKGMSAADGAHPENINTDASNWKPEQQQRLGGAMFSRSIGDTLNAAANNVRDVKLPAGYKVSDLINSAPGKLNWWHKTIGTQYNLAQRSAPFKRVFDSVQNFINDVSFFATEAADLAPNILPQLETWKDIGKSPLSAADTKAISAPIFEGTLIWARDESGKPVKIDDLTEQSQALQVDQKAQRLLRGGHVSENVMKMWQGLPIDQFETIINGKYERDVLKAGVVWTDAELRSIFNLTDKQIPLYHEFRKATDKSLTNLAIADMLRFGGEDVAPIREQVLASKDVTEAAETLRDYLLSLTDIDPDRADVLTDTANKMIEKGDKAADLIKRGYAPLSRFGQYTLDVVDDGERVYFGMFENKWEAARMNRQMRAEYPGAQITQGTVSEQAYKMFAGVSPETLELFGDMLGLEAQGDDASAKAFQEYLKLAKSSRSAMKRLIHRKGIAGFNEDAGRVLAGFVYSNARQTASSLHMGEMTNAANDISQTQGELKDAAVKLVDYIKNPQEEAQKLRGLLFAQYIGGSVASAMVNITQPLTMTFPWLSQYGTIANAAKQMTAATKDALKRRTGDAKLDAALHRAEEDGTVSPQEVHQLMQQAQGKGALRSGDGTTAGNAMATAENSLSRFSLAWGKLFSTAEQFNRRVTFIAAYRTAIEKGMADPDGFARKAIAETQGVYTKGNKPAWARGAIGGTLFTFKQYSINYVEMLSRMAKSGPQGKKAALLALGVLFLMSGAGGMPGADDLDDIISGALQALGYNFDSRNKRKEFLAGLLGEDGARFVEHGVSGLPGVPIDVSGRLGLGNLIPGTGLLTKKTDHTRDVAELAGPAGDLAKRTFDAAGKLITGDVVGAGVSVSPKAFQNLHQAYDMASMGMYRDATGKKVIDTDGYDAIAKAIGFQPTDVKRVQDASIEVQRMIGLNKMRESEIADKWALGLFEKDAGKVQDAKDDLQRWNADNPNSPIRINFGQIAKRMQKMNESKTQRIAKTAPREIRATVRRELATP